MIQLLFRVFDRVMGGQWACPHGPLGWLAARLMVYGNARLNELGVEALDVRAGDAVLEIGFGPAVALERLCELAGDGRVAGLDASESMVRAAGRRFERQIASGRVELKRGLSSALPYTDASFGRVLTVNTIYFWEHPDVDLREVRRILKAGGRFVLTLRAVNNEDGRLAVHGMPSPVLVDDVRDWMRVASFAELDERTVEAPFGPERVTGVALIGTAA